MGKGDSKKDTCNDCLFFDLMSDSIGKCRRHSPVVVRVEHFEAEDVYSYGYPQTKVDKWCGDYKPAIPKLRGFTCTQCERVSRSIVVDVDGDICLSCYRKKHGSYEGLY